jgi:hypothetical protein
MDEKHLDEIEKNIKANRNSFYFELERFIGAKEVIKLIKKVRRLRKALKWYADEENYSIIAEDEICVALFDLGARARKALGLEE